MDVKAVGAVLTYAMIAQDFATLTKAKWLHTTAQHGRVATKSTHYFNQTPYISDLCVWGDATAELRLQFWVPQQLYIVLLYKYRFNK